MKLSVGIILVLTCFVASTASSQMGNSPKKATANAKSDTSVDAKLKKLSDEFDYFGKADSTKVRLDTSFGAYFNKILDEFLRDDDKKETKKSSLQQDKTLNWQLQRGNTDVWVTTTSPLSNTDHYNGFVIAPQQAKTLHLDVTGTFFLTNNYRTQYVPFYFQVKNNKSIFINELEQGKKMLNISLSGTDSIAVYFIAHPNEKDTVDFHCIWSIGDTAAYSYTGQKPETVFDKMLELAPNQFTNIRLDKTGMLATIDYPDGLFAPLPAQRIAFDTHVTQYTGKKLESGKAADLINAEWNKKITSWLKDYNVTDIKKTETGDRSKNTDGEITTYTKRDSAGKILFIVKVFKEEVDEEGSVYEVATWNTGVSIY
jgi:hypothetical protein